MSGKGRPAFSRIGVEQLNAEFADMAADMAAKSVKAHIAKLHAEMMAALTSPTIASVLKTPHPTVEPKPDPLAVVIDGMTLRALLSWDEMFRRGDAVPITRDFTPAQRAAISAHWSAELHAKVESKRKADLERDRLRVVVDLEDW